MRTCDRRVRISLWAMAALWLAWVSPAVAQEADEVPPERVRGILTSVEGEKLVVMNDDEEEIAVTLKDDAGVFVVTPAKLGDIAAGQFVGVTSVPSKDQRVALEVHIFADDLRGTAEGHYAWDLAKGASTMTNATVAEVKEVRSSRELKLTYRGEQGGQGEQTILVPEFAEIVHLAKADRSALQPDTKAFLLVEEAQDGSKSAVAVAVGAEGASPPM